MIKTVVPLLLRASIRAFATDGASAGPGARRLYHGTRDDLRPGERVAPAGSAAGAGALLSPELDAAIWAAELSPGDAPPRVYVVETDGGIEDVPDLTAGKGHPVMSWRALGPVWISSEITEWTYYHGTRATLGPGDLLLPGSDPNFGRTLSHVYLTRTLDAAIWAAELARGDGPGRIYRVVPTGPVEDDPNVTDKKFRGNPTKSFRSRHPLRVIGEVTAWTGHSDEAVRAMKAGLERLARQGIGPIDD